jgi:hypothetical protein
MNIPKAVVIAVLFVVACSQYTHAAAEQDLTGIITQPIHGSGEVSQECLNLRDTLRDKERSQILLRDRAGMHIMLKNPELRQEILQHPRFLRQMMQTREMRQELLHNEQMMHEMLRNRDIHREVNRNREMVEEIEKNETYRHLNQEHQADILEELLLESTPQAGSNHSP